MIVEESQKATKNTSVFKVRQYSCRVQNLKGNSNQVNPILKKVIKATTSALIKLLKKNAPKIKHTIAAARLHRAVVRWSDGLLHIYII